MGITNRLGSALTGALALALTAGGAFAATHGYVQTNIVSDGNVPAAVTDPNLVNAWGIAFFPGDPFWINDNGTGLSTLYDGLGDIIPLVVTVPLPPGSTNPNSSPTGLVWNPSPDKFIIPGTQLPALFIFAAEDGTISGWNPGVDFTHAKMIIDNSQGGSSSGAVYKGLALGVNASGLFLYATNFRSGKVDVWDSSFQPANLSGSFSDPSLPTGAAPFGIANISGNLFVSYAKQDAEKHDDVAGKGNGFVDIYDTNGNLIRHFAARGSLNSPWGMARAPFNFGGASDDILVGNFGDGRINLFDSKSGHFVGQLKDPAGQAIVIDGLWGLSFGGATASDPSTLYFTAGPNGESDGLFGSIAVQ